MSDDLLVARQGGVVTVTFNRPQTRNAFTFDMYERLAAVCADIDADAVTKVLVLTGSGEEAFASGTDIAQFRSFASDADALAYEARVERVLCAIESCRVPSIAALAGACIGGGAVIAAACDLRIAADNLKFGFPIARTLGNCLSLENVARLVALIGEARVMDMMLTARLFTAAEAEVAGLVREVVPIGDLQARATDLADRMAAYAPLTIHSTRLALRRLRGAVVPADDLVKMCYGSGDFREGVEAFVTKRRPNWTGR